MPANGKKRRAPSMPHTTKPSSTNCRPAQQATPGLPTFSSSLLSPVLLKHIYTVLRCAPTSSNMRVQ